MLKGKYVGATVLLNTQTKFAKLQVGKYFVSANARKNPGEPLFPLAIALNGLHPLTKVWVDYLPLPKNTFVIKVNDADIYSFVKEEVDYDPSKTEALCVTLDINDTQDVIYDSTPWIIDDVADIVESALGIEHLTSLTIIEFECKSWVANEFLDLMCSYELPE